MKKKLFILLLISLVIIQCKKDDDTISEYEAREYSDQVIDDQIALEEYLQSHTYNYEDFNSNSNIDVDIKFLKAIVKKRKLSFLEYQIMEF